MFDQLSALSYFLEDYINAISDGFDEFAQTLPIYVKQNLQTHAKRKLDDTYTEYMNAVNVNVSNDVLIVALDEDNWLANALESGVEPFSMKETHLRSKYKISKEGYKYKVIPMRVSKKKMGSFESFVQNRREMKGGDGFVASSDKYYNQKAQAAFDFQSKIKKLLVKPKFGVAKTKQDPATGVYVKSQQVISDPSFTGLYRIQQFNESENAATGRNPSSTQYVLFRVMSEKPGTAKWEHPGLQPRFILRDTHTWLLGAIDDLLEASINRHLEVVFGGK